MRRKTIAAAVLTLAVGGTLMIAGQSFAARDSATVPRPVTGHSRTVPQPVTEPATDQSRAVTDRRRAAADQSRPTDERRTVADKRRAASDGSRPVADQRGPSTDARGSVPGAAPVDPREPRTGPAPARR